MSLFLKKTWLIFLGFLIALTLLILAFWKLDWSQFWTVIERIQPFPWIPLAILAYLLGHVARGFRLHYLVSQQCSLTVFTATNIVVFGYAMNNILPLRLGEVARIGMLCERTGLPIAQSATVTFLERALDGLTILALFFLSSFFVNQTNWLIGDTMNLVGVILLLGLCFILFAVFFPLQLTRLALLLTKRLSSRAQESCLQIISQIINGVGYLRSFNNAVRIIFWCLLIWLLESLTFLFVFPAFGIAMNPFHALFVMSVVNLAILIPSTPGYIGPFHYFAMQSLMLFGILKSEALSYAFLVHMIIYIPLTLWGLGIIYWYSIQLKRTLSIVEKAKLAKQKKEVNGVELSILAHLAPQNKKKELQPFLRAIIETLLQNEMKSLSIQQKKEQLDSITMDFEMQIAELSPVHQFLFKMGLLGFRIYVFFRYFHSFNKLSDEKRTKAVNDWSYGKISLPRKLFRLIRSFVFVMYYDQPLPLQETISTLEKKQSAGVYGVR